MMREPKRLDDQQLGVDETTDGVVLAKLIASLPSGISSMPGALSRMIELAADGPDATLRTHRPGHFTGSALVVDPSSAQFVLLHHRKLGRWLQPGGHADGNPNLGQVALREAAEETGLRGLLLVDQPIDLDIHTVRPPGEDDHEHFDVRYLILATDSVVLDRNDESTDIRWVSENELDVFDVDESVRRLVRSGLRMLELA